MEKVVKISPWQKVTTDDYNKFGVFARQSFDTVVGKTLIPDIAFEGFVCAQTGPAEVTVAPGHLWYLGKIFVNDSTGGTQIDLSAHLPAATRRIITISAYGTEMDSKLEARTFLTDADTRATVARETSTEGWRWANVAAVAGVEGPDPQASALATNVCPLAYVTLSTLGVESIQRASDFVVPTLRGLNSRMNEFDLWRIQIGTLIDTLRSDLAALAAQIYGLAKMAIVRQLAADVGRLKDKFRLPDAYQSYAVDHFLTNAETDMTHVDQLCKVEEGVRFPPVAGFDAQLGLLNPLDTLVVNSSNVILPWWEHFKRITNVSFGAEVSISQYNYQTVDMVQKTMTRQRIRYGTPFTLCTNNAYWQTGGYTFYVDSHGFSGTLDYVTWTFTRYDGEVFNVLDVGEYFTSAEGLITPRVIRLQQVWYDTVEEPYWDKVTENYSVSGAVVAQTWLNSQDGWVTKVDLFFSRVAATGNVDVLICELSNGVPDTEKILARSTRSVPDLKVSTHANYTTTQTEFLFQPTFLRKGRYGIIIVSPGNHYVWVAKNTNYISGTMFTSTDGAWFQGDLVTDINLNIHFAKFKNNRSQVQLLPLQLGGGIAAIDINADAIVPEGCQLYYQIQLQGTNVWHDLDDVDGGPSVLFIGLPPLLQFRAVFIGSDSVQPALGVASNSRVTTWRPRSDFKHISEDRTFPSSSKVQADFRIEAWRGAPFHSILFRLCHGAGFTTLRAPDVLSSEQSPDDPTGKTRIFHCTWTGMGALTTCKFRIEGTTDNVLTTYHVAERFDIEDPNTGIGT